MSKLGAETGFGSKIAARSRPKSDRQARLPAQREPGRLDSVGPKRAIVPTRIQAALRARGLRASVFAPASSTLVGKLPALPRPIDLASSERRAAYSGATIG